MQHPHLYFEGSLGTILAYSCNTHIHKLLKANYNETSNNTFFFYVIAICHTTKLY